MRIFKHSSLFLLTSLVACTSTPEKNYVSKRAHVSRHISSMNETLNDKEQLATKVDKLLSGVFHSYLIGQVHLHDFDQVLNKNPEKALKSDAYNSLLAVRTYVDQFEHDVNDLYLDLVLVTALPEYSPEQKLNAEFALYKMGQFLEGIGTDNKWMPENLRPLILSNLREKQTHLYEELKALHDDSQFTNNDPEIKKALHKNMVLLRATRRAYFKNLQNYHVSQEVLAQTIKEQKNKTSFKKLESEIKALSHDMKKFTSELGRGTSSDAIYPSAGPNGNITGRGFPARTWSLTYDDGPGGKTTSQVVDNLVARKIPASFFVLAKQVEALPSVAKKIKDSGMEIASHSYTHAQLTKVSASQLEREIGTSKKVIQDKLGVEVKLFRLPYGAGVSVSNVRAKIAEHKMVHVFWNVDTLDWQDKNPQSIFNRTIKQMNASPKNAGVILFHDIHSQSVTASTMLMDYFNKEKLKICTVQEVIDQQNNNLSSCR